MNAKEQAQARFRQAVLDMRDVVRHGNQDVLGRHTDDALMFGDAYAVAAECVAEAREPLVEALQLVEWIDCVVSLGEGDEDSWRECACCRNRREQGHTEDCPIAAALAKETP